jgi:hypothetical protein
VTDTNDAVLRVSQSDEGWSIIAHQRVRAIAVGRLPTAEDYHAALVQCLKDKAAEIERRRSHVELLEACSKASHSAIMVLDSAVKNMADEIERLRLTDAERFVLREVTRSLADTDDVVTTEQAAVIDWLLERTR